MAALATSFVPSGPALAATTLWVAKRDGSCSNSGAGTSSAPLCSLSVAAARATPGTTVLVGPGIYRERITPVASGTERAPIVYQASGPDVIVRGTVDFSDANEWKPTATNAWSTRHTKFVAQVFVNGARLARAPSAAESTTNSFFYDPEGDRLYVDVGGENPGTGNNVEVGTHGYGFDVVGLSNLVIDGFEIVAPNYAGIRIKASTGITVRNVDVSYAGRQGIYVQADSRRITLRANEVSFSGSNGIRILRSDGVTVAANSSHHNGLNGIALYGANRNLIVGNLAHSNSRPVIRSATGIDINGASSNNVVRANIVHDNQDSGLQVYNQSDDNLVARNLSYGNGDHGFDTIHSTGTRYISNTSYGNHRDGFAIEGNSTSTVLANNIGANNGLSTGRTDLFVGAASVSGFSSDYDLFWHTGDGPEVRFDGVVYGTVAAFRGATGNEVHGIEADPKFRSVGDDDFRLRSDSPAVDSANAGAPRFVAADLEGVLPVDDPAVSNDGAGLPPYADRGAYERDLGAVATRIFGLSRTSGSTAGGTRVTIRGSGFTAVRSVLFGGVAARSHEIVSDSRIAAVSPRHRAGTVDVMVVTDDGRYVGVIDRFRFVAQTYRATSRSSIRHRSRPHSFTGRVRASRASCIAGRRVTVVKVRRGPDLAVRRTRAGRTGRWSVGHRRGGAGRYYALVGARVLTTSLGDTLECLRGRSSTIRVRR